jgi:hypothetical protein
MFAVYQICFRDTRLKPTGTRRVLVSEWDTLDKAFADRDRRNKELSPLHPDWLFVSGYRVYRGKRRKVSTVTTPRRVKALRRKPRKTPKAAAHPWNVFRINPGRPRTTRPSDL